VFTRTFSFECFQMASHENSGGIRALVVHTAGMAELAITVGHPDRKHNEYLPYPDENFTETIDQHLQRSISKEIS